MDKTISASVPEEDYLEIKQLAEREGESVSGLIKNLMRREISGADAGKKEDPKLEEILTLLWRLVEAKPVQNPTQNSEPTMAKKIEEVIKILAGFTTDLSAQIGILRDDIANMPKPNVGDVEGKSDTNTGKKLDDLGRAIGEIRDALGQKGYLKNRKVREAVITSVVAGIVVIFLLVGEGIYRFGRAEYKSGEMAGVTQGNVAAWDLKTLVDCSQPGWKTQTLKTGEVMCFPYPAKEGTYGWRIK